MAELLPPAVSIQPLPSPILTTAAAPAPLPGGSSHSRQRGSAPQAGSRGKSWLGSHTALSLPLPIHRPAEGVQGAQVTQLPSIRLVLKELRGRNAVSVPPASALPPGAAPDQHQLHRSSPSALFPLLRRRHWMPAAWRSCSSARLRSGSLEAQSLHPHLSYMARDCCSSLGALSAVGLLGERRPFLAGLCQAADTSRLLRQRWRTWPGGW